MKCWHLAAALGLAACGLNSEPVPQAGRFDAGASGSSAEAERADQGGQSLVAGSPANWPTRARAPQLDPGKDGGSSDTEGSDGSVAPNSQASGGSGGIGPSGSSATNQGGQSGTSPSGGNNPPSIPGGAVDAGAASLSTKPSNGSHSTRDAGHVDDDKASADDTGKGQDNDQDDRGSSHDDDPGTSSGGTQGPAANDPVGDTIGTIVDLVLAILDLSLGPVRPAEVEDLVSAILVFSLSPVELAADSLTAVLDALDGTRICREHPDHCNPLCQDLANECRVCDHDDDCVEHIEETCKVHLPDWCY